ncbi:hypothetical protein HDV00_011176 [Rhizophlyctis rosea]|nr:hypothetical protein HDV00_011176 [Rhizophlyctis rosea]
MAPSSSNPLKGSAYEQSEGPGGGYVQGKKMVKGKKSRLSMFPGKQNGGRGGDIGGNRGGDQGNMSFGSARGGDGYDSANSSYEQERPPQFQDRPAQYQDRQSQYGGGGRMNAEARGYGYGQGVPAAAGPGPDARRGTRMEESSYSGQEQQYSPYRQQGPPPPQNGPRSTAYYEPRDPSQQHPPQQRYYEQEERTPPPHHQPQQPPQSQRMPSQYRPDARATYYPPGGGPSIGGFDPKLGGFNPMSPEFRGIDPQQQQQQQQQMEQDRRGRQEEYQGSPRQQPQQRMPPQQMQHDARSEREAGPSTPLPAVPSPMHGPSQFAPLTPPQTPGQPPRATFYIPDGMTPVPATPVPGQGPSTSVAPTAVPTPASPQVRPAQQQSKLSSSPKFVPPPAAPRHSYYPPANPSFKPPPPPSGMSNPHHMSLLPPSQLPEIPIPMLDFVRQFVIPDAITPIPERPTAKEIGVLCTNYLTSVRLPPKDVQIEVDEGPAGPGIIYMSARGLRVLEQFREMKRRRGAATLIQSVWRMVRARRAFERVREERLYEELAKGGISNKRLELPMLGGQRQSLGLSDFGKDIFGELGINTSNPGSREGSSKGSAPTSPVPVEQGVGIGGYNAMPGAGMGGGNAGATKMPTPPRSPGLVAQQPPQQQQQQQLQQPMYQPVVQSPLRQQDMYSEEASLFGNDAASSSYGHNRTVTNTMMGMDYDEDEGYEEEVMGTSFDPRSFKGSPLRSAVDGDGWGARVQNGGYEVSQLELGHGQRGEERRFDAGLEDELFREFGGRGMESSSVSYQARPPPPSMPLPAQQNGGSTPQIQHYQQQPYHPSPPPQSHPPPPPPDFHPQHPLPPPPPPMQKPLSPPREREIENPYSKVPPRTHIPTSPPRHPQPPPRPIQTPSPEPQRLEPVELIPTVVEVHSSDDLPNDLTPPVEATSASLPRPVRVDSEADEDLDGEWPEKRLEREWWEKKRREGGDGEDGAADRAGESVSPEKEEESKQSLRRHLHRVSVAYQEILASKSRRKSTVEKAEGAATGTPTVKEIEFMKLLNSERTFRASRMFEGRGGNGGVGGAGGGVGKVPRWVDEDGEGVDDRRVSTVPKGASPQTLYNEYSPRIITWLTQILALTPPADATTTDLLTLLSSGDILCQLSVTLFPRIQCHLLNKGPEYTIHKIIFFLELCKTVGIKGQSLCSVEDLVGGGFGFVGEMYGEEGEGEGGEGRKEEEAGVRVVRTVMAFERQARKRGWKGAVLSLDGVVSEGGDKERRKSKRMSHRRRSGVEGGGDKERERERRRSRRQSRIAGGEDAGEFGGWNAGGGKKRPVSMASRKSVDSLYSLYAGLPEDQQATLGRSGGFPSLGRKGSGMSLGRHGRSGSEASSMRRPHSAMSEFGRRSVEVEVVDEDGGVVQAFVDGEESEDDMWGDFMPSESDRMGSSSPPRERVVPTMEQQQRPFTGRESETPSPMPTFPPRPAVLRVVDPNPEVVEGSHLVRQVSSYKYSGVDDEPLSAEVGDTSVPTLGRVEEEDGGEGFGGGLVGERVEVEREVTPVAIVASPPPPKIPSPIPVPVVEVPVIPVPVAPVVDLEKLERERKQQEIVDRRTKRRNAIEAFIANEETYLQNLQTVHDYLTSLIKRRKRLSKRMSVISTSTTSAGSFSSQANAPSESISGPDARRDGEDDSTYIGRLDTENEELEEVRGAIRGMLDVHGRLAGELEVLVSRNGEGAGVLKAGDVFLRFANAVQKPYIGYSVAALGAQGEGRKGAVERLHGKESERVEFVRGVVDRFVRERRGSIGSEGGDGGQETEWAWYMRHPITRLGEYTALVGIVVGASKGFKGVEREVVIDDRKLVIGGLKVAAVGKAIGERLGVRG